METPNAQVTLFIIVATAIVFLLAALIVALLFLYQRKQLAYSRHLNALKHDFEKNLLQTQIEVQEQTFQNISREIHDNINLSLTLAKLNLNTLDWTDLSKTREAVKSSVTILGSAINDLSNLSKSINTDLIKEMGLMKALKAETQRISQMSKLNIAFEVKGEPVFLESEKELVIFRIIQEALNNVIKHSGSSKAFLLLDYRRDCLKVILRDNGMGFNKEEVANRKERGNAGLKNMQTRTNIFGGKFLIESQIAKGTSIHVTIPYNYETDYQTSNGR